MVAILFSQVEPPRARGAAQRGRTSGNPHRHPYAGT
jgi:hypothetical protein